MRKILPGSSRGFTLVEVLVALAISGIILAAILQVFSNSQTSYNTQEDVAAMQQNVRVAKMLLERDVRMAGSGAMNLQGPDKDDPRILPLLFENAQGVTGTDRLTVIYQAPDGGTCGTLMLENSKLAATTEAEVLDSSGWETGSCSWNGTDYTLPVTNMPVVISSPDKSTANVLIATAIGSNKVTFGPDAIPDSEGAALYNLLEINPGNSLPNTHANDLAANSSIQFFNLYKAVYYVAPMDNGNPGLWRDTGTGGELIAENIEDFQCAFQLEDGTWIDNRDLTDTEIPDVRLVRLNLVARGVRPDNNFSGGRPGLEDHAAGPADNFRRRPLTFTVKVRNFGL